MRETAETTDVTEAVEAIEDKIDLAADKLEYFYMKGYELGIDFAPKLILAILTLLIGLWIINGIRKVLTLSMQKSGVETTVIPFVSGVLTWVLKVLLFISVASMVGIATTSFIAILGAAGLAVGLALQGSLSNFAGGVLIIIFKPYRIGDFIKAQGHLGEVKEVHVFYTVIISPEARRIIIPNGPISNGSIINYTVEGKIRVDLMVGIAYNEDIIKAKEVLMDVLVKHDKVLTHPDPFVGVHALADSSVNLAVRPHCHPQDYWDVYFDINEQVKIALDQNGITIPFPQRDVHLSNA